MFRKIIEKLNSICGRSNKKDKQQDMPIDIEKYIDVEKDNVQDDTIGFFKIRREHKPWLLFNGKKIIDFCEGENRKEYPNCKRHCFKVFSLNDEKFIILRVREYRRIFPPNRDVKIFDNAQDCLKYIACHLSYQEESLEKIKRIPVFNSVFSKVLYQTL
ncbi:MAG: hypothetical protein ACOCQR_02500 [bacterium]